LPQKFFSNISIGFEQLLDLSTPDLLRGIMELMHSLQTRDFLSNFFPQDIQ